MWAQISKVSAILMAIIMPQMLQRPLYFAPNWQYAIVGWTLETQDHQAFHNKHLVSSPSLLNHDPQGFPHLHLHFYLVGITYPPLPPNHMQGYITIASWHLHDTPHTSILKMHGFTPCNRSLTCFQAHELRLFYCRAPTWWDCDCNSNGPMFMFIFLNASARVAPGLHLALSSYFVKKLS